MTFGKWVLGGFLFFVGIAMFTVSLLIIAIGALGNNPSAYLVGLLLFLFAIYLVLRGYYLRAQNAPRGTVQVRLDQ